MTRFRIETTMPVAKEASSPHNGVQPTANNPAGGVAGPGGGNLGGPVPNSRKRPHSRNQGAGSGVVSQQHPYHQGSYSGWSATILSSNQIPIQDTAHIHISPSGAHYASVSRLWKNILSQIFHLEKLKFFHLVIRYFLH